MSESTDDPVADLRTAAERVEKRREEVAEAGLDRDELESVADAHRSVEVVLDRWEERATDWDDFEGYVKFRNDLAETLESIPDDVPERAAFLEADGCVKTSGVSKSLNASDFADARAALESPREYAELRGSLESALDVYRKARTRTQKRKKAQRERIEELEELLELGSADLDAPTETLREPIAEYNDAVADTFDSFRREATAEAFLAFVEDAAHTPFVAFQQPPDELLEYVQSVEAGASPVDELLEYAEYSSSKLSHYVEDANRLKRRIATNRTYLEGLSAEPLQIEWPPAPAEELRYRIAELISLVGRLADESAVSTLRTIQGLTRNEEYDRLRRAAEAEAQLSDEERRRLEGGEVESELTAAREELDRIETALEETASVR
jgi:hypothetical protein